MATVLMRGSKGALVREMQLLLNKAGARPPLDPDGHWGQKTDAAVIAFQRQAGLVPDARYGDQTRTALRQATTPAKAPTRAEPDKSAMQGSAPAGAGLAAAAKAPPNAASLQLLDTARPIDEIFFHCAATPEGKDFTVAQWKLEGSERALGVLAHGKQEFQQHFPPTDYCSGAGHSRCCG